MSHDEPDSGDEDDPEDERARGHADVNVGLGGLLGSIGEIIEALDEIEDLEERSDAGRVDRDSFTIDYNYDVNVGIGGDGNRRRRSRRERREPKKTVDVDDQAHDPDYTVDVREYEDEVIVSADLPGIDEEELDVSVEAESGDLEIRTGEEVLERVSVDPDLSVADVSFKNKILQIRLRREGDDE